MYFFLKFSLRSNKTSSEREIDLSIVIEIVQ